MKAKKRKALLREMLRSLVNLLVLAGLIHLCVIADWTKWEQMWPVLAGLAGYLFSRLIASLRIAGS